jgi:hypothetical protein
MNTFVSSGPGQPRLILTPEQKALRLVQQRHSEEGQLALTSRAIGRAIGAVNQDLVEEGCQPSFTAVLGALGNALAEHLAKLDDPRMRARLVNSMATELPLQVERRVSAADEGRG